MSAFSGKVVFLTGASRGIGEETALAFGREGGRVALFARSRKDLDRVAWCVRDAGGEALVLPGDVADRDAVFTAVEEVQEAWGPVDILVNNAGYGVSGLIEELPIEAIRRNHEVNVLGSLHAIQAVLPEMKRRRSGAITNVSSVIGYRSVPALASYCATKFALNAYTEALRIEVAPHGIHVMLVAPGYTATPFHEGMERHGTPSPVSPFKGQGADKVARAILRGLRRRRRDVILTASGRLMVFLARRAPRLLDRLVAAAFRKQAAAKEDGNS